LLLVTTQLEVLTSLQSQLSLGLTVDTLQSQNNLLGGLSLLVENWLGLTTETGLLTVVSSLTLSEQGSLTSLVLGNLVLGVLSALLTLTVSLSELRNVNWRLVRCLLMKPTHVIECFVDLKIFLLDILLEFYYFEVDRLGLSDRGTFWTGEIGGLIISDSGNTCSHSHVGVFVLDIPIVTDDFGR